MQDSPPRDVQVVILAAGKGTRMRAAKPKVLHPLCGRTMLEWVLDAVRAIEPSRIVIVVGHGAEEVERCARAAAPEQDLHFVVQEPQLGTGHAVQVAASALAQRPGAVLVTYGDMPLLTPASFLELLEEREAAGEDALALATADSFDPHGYGRILRDEEGFLAGIVEERDATPEEREICEVNLGVYAFDGPCLLRDLPRLSNENVQKEYYLTDLPGLAVADGRVVVPVVLDEEESLGVNTVAQLGEARAVLQDRILLQHMNAGVIIEDPSTTYIDHGVTIGAETHILPCTVIRGGVHIGAGCEVGPFAHLRVGTRLEDGAQVGNFTECKQSTLGRGSKAKHLSYLGNVTVGAKTNIGAGTIFANYDGKAKHPTQVGDGVFIGSGTIVVAPNEIPDGVTTGAGAVLTRSARIEVGETWVGMPARRHRSAVEATQPAPAPREAGN